MSLLLNCSCQSNLAPGMRPGDTSLAHSAPARLKRSSSPAPNPCSEATFALEPERTIRIWPLVRRRRTSGSASRKASVLVTELYGHVMVISPRTTREAWSDKSGLSWAIGVVGCEASRAEPSPSTNAILQARRRGGFESNKRQSSCFTDAVRPWRQGLNVVGNPYLPAVSGGGRIKKREKRKEGIKCAAGSGGTKWLLALEPGVAGG